MSLLLANRGVYKVEGIPKDGLVAEWTFSGNANDTSGSGYNGTVSGADLTTDRKNKTDSAYDFIFANSDYIEIGDVLDFRLSDWTLSLWVRPSSFGSIEGIFGKSLAGGTPGRWGFYMLGKVPYFLFHASVQYAIAGISGLVALTWYHLCVTVDRSGYIRMYINSILNDSLDISSEFSYDLQTNIITRFGSYNDGAGSPGNYLDGKVDDTRVYNRVLSTDEIKALYNE